MIAVAPPPPKSLFPSSTREQRIIARRGFREALLADDPVDARRYLKRLHEALIEERKGNPFSDTPANCIKKRVQSNADNPHYNNLNTAAGGRS